MTRYTRSTQTGADRRAADPLPFRCKVPGVGQPGEGDVETDRQGVRVEWAEGALGTKDD